MISYNQMKTNQKERRNGMKAQHATVKSQLTAANKRRLAEFDAEYKSARIRMQAQFAAELDELRRTQVDDITRLNELLEEELLTNEEERLKQKELQKLERARDKLVVQQKKASKRKSPATVSADTSASTSYQRNTAHVTGAVELRALKQELAAKIYSRIAEVRAGLQQPVPMPDEGLIKDAVSCVLRLDKEKRKEAEEESRKLYL